MVVLGLAVVAGCGRAPTASSSAGGASGSGGAAGAGGAPAADTSSVQATVAVTSVGSGAGGEGGMEEASGGSAAVGTGGAGGASGEASEPDFATLPWITGDDVGFGVARKDSQNPRGDGVFIGYAGYALPLDAAEAWVSALYESTLRDLGVRHVFAVQGPATPLYDGYEIGNSRIAAYLTGPASDAPFIVAFAHSSGSYVAHELLRQLAGDLDPAGVTEDKVIYFDLDGGTGGLDGDVVARLRRAYFVAAVDLSTSTPSPNRSGMQYGASLYPDAGGFIDLDASASGCSSGATWCVHMTPITTTPHDPDAASGVADYTDFVGRPVVHSFLDAKREDAGLPPLP